MIEIVKRGKLIWFALYCAAGRPRIHPKLYLLMKEPTRPAGPQLRRGLHRRHSTSPCAGPPPTSVTQDQVRAAPARLPQDQGRPRRHARPARHRHPAGLHRPRHQDGRRPAGRGEGVRRRRHAGRHDPQLRPRTPRRPRPSPPQHITRGKVLAALAALTGERLQAPPVYSAKKIDGTRAYELARAGEEVDNAQGDASTSTNCSC